MQVVCQHFESKSTMAMCSGPLCISGCGLMDMGYKAMGKMHLHIVWRTHAVLTQLCAV